MALEIVTDGKNDKTKKNYQEYVHDKRMRIQDGTCVLLCVVPFVVVLTELFLLLEQTAH